MFALFHLQMHINIIVITHSTTGTLYSLRSRGKTVEDHIYCMFSQSAVLLLLMHNSFDSACMSQHFWIFTNETDVLIFQQLIFPSLSKCCNSCNNGIGFK